MKRVRGLAVLAAWFAMATGLAELAMRAVQKLYLHRIIYLSRDIVWMTPLADLLVFLAIALILLACSAIRPAAAQPRVAVPVFAFVAALSVLTMQPWMAWWAMLALAFGVAATASRIVGAWETPVLKLVRFTLPVLLGIVVVLGIIERGGMARAERRALAALPAPAPGAPNVLMVVWDAVRARDVSRYGYGRRTTPRLDAFAATGVTFDRAVSTASYTLPAHASLFTGRWAHQLTTSWETPMDGAPPTLAEALAARGYRTGAFSANHILVTWEHGVLRGFSRANDYAISAGELARSSSLIKWLLAMDRLRGFAGWYDTPGRRDAADIRGSFLSWLGNDTTRPFFGFLNLYDAHDPYLPRAPFDTLFGASAMDAATRRLLGPEAIGDRHEMTPAAIDRLHDQYDRSIAELDHETGLLLDELERRGQLRNTIVIITADHGEAFGEHRGFAHGNDLYTEAIGVPLVIVYPGRTPAGARVRQLVSLRDVPATIAELLGDQRPAWPLPGNSLGRLWRDSSLGADTVVAEIDRIPRGGKAWLPVRRGDVRSMIVWPWQLITVGTQPELYDLAADSMQRHSLATTPEHAARRDAMLAALRRWRGDAVPAKAERAVTP